MYNMSRKVGTCGLCDQQKEVIVNHGFTNSPLCPICYRLLEVCGFEKHANFVEPESFEDDTLDENLHTADLEHLFVAGSAL